MQLRLFCPLFNKAVIMTDWRTLGRLNVCCFYNFITNDKTRFVSCVRFFFFPFLFFLPWALWILPLSRSHSAGGQCVRRGARSSSWQVLVIHFWVHFFFSSCFCLRSQPPEEARSSSEYIEAGGDVTPQPSYPDLVITSSVRRRRVGVSISIPVIL